MNVAERSRDEDMNFRHSRFFFLKYKFLFSFVEPVVGPIDYTEAVW